MKRFRAGIVALTAGGVLAAAGTQAFAGTTPAAEPAAAKPAAAQKADTKGIAAAQAFGALTAAEPKAKDSSSMKPRATPATTLYASALAVRVTGKAGVKAGLKQAKTLMQGWKWG